MADKTEIRGVPANVSGELAGFLTDLRRLAMRSAKKLDTLDEIQQTLADLLKGAATLPATRGLRLPPVTGFKVNKLPNSIEFVLTPMKLPFVFPPIVDFDFSNLKARVQLWRAFSNENALNAEFLKETTTLGLQDHPPPGVKYRYWMRYVTDDAFQNGPFSPFDGIEFTADEVLNPEDQFSPSSGGIFLETFEGMDVPTRWTEQDPLNNLPSITYPAQGVVGGIVAQFSGDESWRVHNDLIPYDPSTLYRYRIGVRYTGAPTNPAKMKFYAGVQCVAADGVTLINDVGANTYSSQHYIAAKGVDLIAGGINNWQTFIGYFSALGTPVTPAPNIFAPSPLFPGTKYFKPMFLVNYDDGDGVVQVDYVRIEALDPLDIALSGTCSPDSIVVRANAQKIVLSFSNALGTYEVRYGSIVLNGSTAVTFSILANPQGLFASINSAGAYSITGGFDSFEDTASITFRATFNGVNVDRIVQLTKSVEGGAGWTPIVDIDSGGGTIVVEGATLTKVGGTNNWESGVYSLEAYTQGAVVSFRAGQTNGYAMIGLNSDPALDANYTSLDFAFYIHNTATLYMYESGINVGSPGPYTTADVLMITYDGEKVRYWQNANLVREVLAPGRSFSLDSSLYSPGVQILDLNFNAQGPIANSNRFATTNNAKYGGSVIEKVGGINSYDSAVYSLDGYGACYLSFTPQIGELAIGLNVDPQFNDSYSSIDFAWIPYGAGANCAIYESGVPITDTGAWTGSTVLSITYDGQYVRYLKNNVIMREFLFPKRVLYFDSSLYNVGAKATNVQFGASGNVGNGASAFIARGTCTVINDTIEKIGGTNSWDSDVYSREGYTEGAFCSARPSFTNKHLMFGLNSDPTTDQSYTSLDYAWYIRGDGLCEVYENGISVSFTGGGSYATSDIFAIRHIGALVQYIRNGIVARSVTRVATTPLFFDGSFADPGGRLEDVHFGPAGKGAEADPSAVYLETFEQPWQTSFTDISTSGTAVITYPNNGTFGGKVISAQKQLWIESNENIPFDDTALYRITTRIRRTVSGGGNEFVYCGVAGVLADGLTMNNESGVVDHSSQHYNCARAFDMSAIGVGTWKDFFGYFRGTGTTGFGVSIVNDAPTPLRTGTKFFRPLLILNYNGGTGTMECDFIKIERLVNPQDADNSDKNRIIPDAEFALAVDDTYWYRNPAGVASSSTTVPAISSTGGAVSGKVTLRTTGSFSPVRRAQIVSRRRTPLQVGSGQLYTVTIRWRRSGSVDGGSFATFLSAYLVRHNQLPSVPVFTLAGSSVQGAGGLSLRGADMDARTVNEWQEDSGIVFMPRSTAVANAAFPYVSAVLSWINSVDRTIEVDYVQIAPGVSCEPQIIVETASFTPSIYARTQYNSASAGDCNLPTLTDDSLIGAKVYLEQIGAGLLTIKPSGGNTLQSSPNSTANRNMAGRYAKAYAEVINSSTWRLTGNLA